MSPFVVLLRHSSIDIQYSPNYFPTFVTNIIYMIRLEHIGIAVRDLEESNAIYEQLLGVAHYKVETV